MAGHEPESGRLRARPGRLRSAVAWYRSELLAGLALVALLTAAVHVLALGWRSLGALLAIFVVIIACGYAIESA